jgi:outer membrane protein assembly factor BamB
MDCAHVRRQIELYVLDGLETAQAAAVRAHLVRCRACRLAEARCQRAIEQVRRQLPTTMPRVPFVRGLRAVLSAEVRSRRRRRRVGRRLVVAGSAAACLLLAVGIWLWLQPGSDPGPAGEVQAVRLVQLWQQGGARATRTSSAEAFLVHGERVYVLLETAGGRAHLAALDVRTGLRQWESPVRSSGRIAADGRRVYCVSPADRDGRALLALDAADGAELWRYRPPRVTPPASACRPVVLSGGWVCWTTRATVHLLRAADGRLLWSRVIPGEGLLSAAAGIGDRLYVLSGAALYCLDAETGTIRWRLACEGRRTNWFRPLLETADGALYGVQRGQADDQLLRVEPTSRRIAWTARVPRVLHMLAAADRLYLRGHGVQALDRATGRPLWTRRVGGCGPVTRAGGLVYFIDSDRRGRLLAVHGETGRQIWTLPGVQSCSAFVRAGGVGYVKTRDGLVQAVALRG